MTALAPVEQVETPALENIEAEAALLGAMMQDNRIVDGIAERVCTDDFAEAMHARIFAAIVNEVSAGRDANPVTLKTLLADDPGLKEVGGPLSYLGKLTGSGAGIIGAKDFASQIADLAHRRRIVVALEDTIGFARDATSDLAEVVADAEAAVADAGNGRGERTAFDLAECFASLDQSFNDDGRGVQCGIIPPLDRVLGPIKPKQVIIMAARPGMGKTAVALNYGRGAARNGHGVLFITLEVDKDELTGRMAAEVLCDTDSQVPYDAIETNTVTQEQRRAIAHAGQHISSLPFVMEDIPSISVNRLASLVRMHKRRFAARGHKLDLVIIDYLQLVEGTSRGLKAYERVSEVSRMVKQCAKANDVGILCLAQLSREVEKRNPPRPILPDLRDSGQIEQDADGVVFLYRAEEYLDRDKPDEADPDFLEWQSAKSKVAGQIEFIVAKRRGRRTGTSIGRWFGDYMAVRGWNQ